MKCRQLSLPIYWSSRKQTSVVARSAPEAELIAISSAMFTEIFNVQTMLEQLLERPVEVNYRQDNQAVVGIVTSGYSAKLRHAPRVHRVNVSSVSEVLSEGFLRSIWYTKTSEQIANGLTKVITPAEWPIMLEQLCVQAFTVEPSTWFQIAAKQPEIAFWASMLGVRGELTFNAYPTMRPSMLELLCLVFCTYFQFDCH